MTRRRIRVTLAALAVSMALPAMAQEEAEDTRGNPFVRPPSAQEEQQREDARTVRLMWETYPEMRSLLLQDVNAQMTAQEIRIRRRMDQSLAEAAQQTAAAIEEAISEAMENVVISRAPAPGEEGETPVSNVPEGATFISCINGKALYRDRDSTLFQIEAAPGDRCAR